MTTALLKSALKLPPAQRILLVEQIWDSLAAEKDVPSLTKAQSDELESRLTRLKKTGSKGSTWNEVKKRVRKRS
ncbi:MAG TPA: addiction module protein [Tepidisphaeraceae bacterium]|jgi:putative addiction module component (TIGR02574 family)